MTLGGITSGGKLGGYNIVNQSVKNLPQDLASATSKVFGNNTKLGATYEAIWYVGSQIVNGTNYLLICKQTRTTKDQDSKIVGVVVNIPAGSVGGGGAKIVEIIEDGDLIEGTNLDKKLKEKFDKALSGLLGVTYKPVLYVGDKVADGTNYYIIAEARAVYPNAEPYAVIVCLNEFEGNVILESIERLK